MAAERANALSLAQAEESASDLSALRAYRRGYQAALTAVALACGLAPSSEEAEAGLALRGGSR